MSSEITQKREESIDGAKLDAKATPGRVDVKEPAGDEGPKNLTGLPVNPLIRVSCGEAGIWGLMIHQGCIAPLRLEPDGSWSPSQIMPKKLAEHLPVFMTQHDLLLTPFGYPRLATPEEIESATAAPDATETE